MFTCKTHKGLKEVVKHHSALITDGKLWKLMEEIPSNLQVSPEGEFLEGVRLYQQHHAPHKRWDVALDAFEQLKTTEEATILNFFILNYRALAMRNANPTHPELSDRFLSAIKVAEELEGSASSLALGFVRLNQAVWLWNQQQLDYAKVVFSIATRSRIEWYRYALLNHNGFVLSGAAEQVRKIWEGITTKWYPKMNYNQRVTLFGIDKELAEEVTRLAPGDRSVL